MDQRSDDELARILWDYNCLEQPLTKSDCIVCLGSKDIRVAQRAADLFLQGYAPTIIFSGNVGRITKDTFAKPEAEMFADEAIRMGVPLEHILIENRSTNTGENIVLVKQLISEHRLDVHSIILVQKPYMLRRAYATFKLQWPDQDFRVTGPQLTFDAYPNEVISKEFLINIMVGDTQRIKVYPAKGFQIPQEMPDEVWVAYQELVRRGYTQHLISEN